MKKVLSVRVVTVALLSVLVAFCVAWGGMSLFSPFGRAEETENETPAPAVAEIVEGYKDKLIDDNIVDGEIAPVILSGTRAEIAAKWSEMCAKATTKYVYLRLDSDWVAERPTGTDGVEQDAAPIFGTGNGFVTSTSVGPGAIDVTGKKVILDLNGHVIDRDLDDPKYVDKNYNGSVIYVSSASSDFVLVDSDPAAEHKTEVDGVQADKYTYEEMTFSVVDPNSWYPQIDIVTKTKAVTGGIITGGSAVGTSQWGISFGGGIRIYNGNLHMFGGTVFGNRVSFNGAGIYANNGGSIVIDGGNVIANEGLSTVSGSLGGGVFISANVEFTLKRGLITANKSRSGAGVYGDTNSVLNIDGGRIISNTAGTSGNGQGGGVYANGALTVRGGEISRNLSGHSGGGIYSSNVAVSEIAGGEISYNLSNVGGGITANTDITLSGGLITHNYAYYRDYGLYFLTPGTLKLAGPVKIKENGTKKSTSNDISGAKTVTVTGELERGTAPDEDCAEIYISEYLSPITGYGENGLNREDGHVIDPSRYFHFTYNPDDIGKAVFQEGVGVIYETPFKTIYYGSNTGNSGDYNIDLQITDSQYGMVMNYGEYGKFGLCVSLESGTGDDSAEENVWFHRYAYDKKNESADEDDLGEYQSYGRAVIEAGIYVGSAQVKTGDGWRYITIRVVVRPKSLESSTAEFGAAGYVKIAYDDADKVFNGTAHTPDVTSVAIEEGENSTWFESLVKDSAYTVEYENNIHVAGASYVVIKGKGNYGGTVKLPFEIVQPSGHYYTESGDADCVTVWQIYNGTAWTDANGSKFTYDDTSKKYSVRALVKSKFDDGTVYNSYVYAADGKEADFKLAVGDTTLIDPGLKLVFKNDGKIVADIFDAGEYAISVECVDEANGLKGDFALPTSAISSDVVMDPYSITKAELEAATVESGKSLLAVVLGNDEYLPFITEVKYVADDVATDGNTLFAYVLYNGKQFDVALNPEFKIDIQMLGRGFVNYVTDVTYKHTVNGATITTLKGEINKMITVTTEISFKLNDNFAVTDGGATGNTGTVTKTWNIVTKHNALVFGDTESTFAYGENGALALPEQSVVGNAMTVTFAKATDATKYENVASVYAEADKLYECVDGVKGDAISGTLREYFDGVLFDNGIGKYRVTSTAADYVSGVDGENGAIYHAVPVTVEFTVTARSISDSAVNTTVATAGLVYSGEAVEAKVTLVFNGVTLEKDVDYTLVYDNNVHAGDGATVSVKGIGNYSGDIERTYAIAKATDNEWTVSLNIASWVTGKFNRNISIVTGRTKYGANTLSYAVEPSEDVAGKLSQDVIDGLRSIDVQNGKVTAATETLFIKLPVGEYTLIAAMQDSTDYNAIGGAFVFNVLEEQYIEPTLNNISDGATQNQVYTGNLLSMSIRNFDGAAMSVECSNGLYFDANGGTVYATNAGTYTVKLHLISDECTWMDGTTDDITLTWTVAPRVVKAPVPDENKFIVNGSIQSYMPQGFDPTLMIIENNERSEAGSTYVTVYLKDAKNYVWDDGTNGARVFAWEIETADWIFVTIACVLGGAVLIAVLFAAGQFFKHRARMADLAEAEKMRGASDNDKGGNA